MNLVLLAGPDDNWTALHAGVKELIGFPSGQYEFIHNTREQVGGYKACSLFSPMSDFNSQMQAVDVARAVMLGLFDPAALERLEDAAQPLPKADPTPRIAAPKLAKARPLERRAFITGQV
jgi:[NiFe] hydrogenase assembly HybE family chaperone